MATKKVIYFTAGEVPTGPELTAIAKLNAAAPANYEVAVRNGSRSTQEMSYGAGIEPCDYVSGTVPTPFNAKTVINPDAIPAQNILSTQKLLTSGQQVACPAPSGTRTTGYVFTIVAGVITAAVGY